MRIIFGSVPAPEQLTPLIRAVQFYVEQSRQISIVAQIELLSRPRTGLRSWGAEREIVSALQLLRTPPRRSASRKLREVREQTPSFRRSRTIGPPQESGSLDVAFEEVQWDATQAVREDQPYTFESPSASQVYIRLKIRATYHGKGKFNPYGLHVDYVKDGNATSPSTDIADESFTSQTEPRDGGSITGFFTFLVPKDGVKDGVFAISTSYTGENEVYVKAE